jgi:hypothetical protein
MIRDEYRASVRLSLAAIATRFAFLAADLTSAPWLSHVRTPFGGGK